MSTLKGSADSTARFETVGTVAKALGSDGSLLIRDLNAVSIDHLVGETVFLVPPPLRGRSRIIESAELTLEGVKIKVSETSDRAAAQDLVGLDLIVSAPSAEEDSIGGELAEDLTGWNVSDLNSSFTGIVAEHFETRAHDVIQVEGDGATALIPLVDEFLADVDVAGQLLTVRLIDGMVEER